MTTTAQVETSHEDRWSPASTRRSASRDEGKPDEAEDGLRVTVEFRGGMPTPSLARRVRWVESQVIDGETFKSCKRLGRPLDCVAWRKHEQDVPRGPAFEEGHAGPLVNFGKVRSWDGEGEHRLAALRDEGALRGRA